MISPTDNKAIRRDPEGDGHWWSRRGRRRHKGVDFIVTPGELVYAPIAGRIERIAYPYADRNYSGIVLHGTAMRLKIFYFKPTPELIGKWVSEKQIIGVAQDISERYSEDMTPHIHLQVDSIDPLILL